MWKYFAPVVELLSFFVILAIDAAAYYSSGRHLSLIPVIVCTAVTLTVGTIAGLAEYEIFKHRHDKETW
jgi:hypothetical protein